MRSLNTPADVHIQMCTRCPVVTLLTDINTETRQMINSHIHLLIIFYINDTLFLCFFVFFCDICPSEQCCQLRQNMHLNCNGMILLIYKH